MVDITKLLQNSSETIVSTLKPNSHSPAHQAHEITENDTATTLVKVVTATTFTRSHEVHFLLAQILKILCLC